MADESSKMENVRNMVVARLEGHEKASFHGIASLRNHYKGVIVWFP